MAKFVLLCVVFVLPRLGNANDTKDGDYLFSAWNPSSPQPETPTYVNMASSVK